MNRVRRGERGGETGRERCVRQSRKRRLERDEYEEAGSGGEEWCDVRRGHEGGGDSSRSNRRENSQEWADYGKADANMQICVAVLSSYRFIFVFIRSHSSQRTRLFF